MLDKIYFWEPESALKYYDWQGATQYYADYAANLYLAGSHSQRKYEILIA